MRASAEPWTLGGTVITWTAFSASLAVRDVSEVVTLILGLTGILATVMTFIVGISKRRSIEIDNRIKHEQLERMKRWSEDKES